MNVNSALGGTSTVAGGAGALAFGGLGAVIGDGGDGVDFELLASGESSSLNYYINIFSLFTETLIVSARCYFPPRFFRPSLA
jgi:hypothetical protein